VKGLDWFIARHYLRAGRGRGLLSLITWIALGGVIVGVAALIIVTAVMTGMQTDLRDKILESTPHVVILQTGSSLRLTDYEQVVDRILEVDGVLGAAPFILSQVNIVTNQSGKRYSQPAYLYGVDIDPTKVAATDMERSIVDGALALDSTESGLPPLLVGRILADRMGLFQGDRILIMAAENTQMNAMGFVPMLQEFEVAGTFATGMYEYDLNNVYTRLEDAQALVGVDPYDASGIGVRTVDAGRAEEFALAVEAHLDGPYCVQSWMERNASLFNALKLEKIGMFLVVFLIVLVAAFNIVSTLVMVVADRTREIGILKTMGMTQRGILRIFVLQGAWIGVMGTAIGGTIGVAIAWAIDRFQLIRIPGDVYFVEYLPAIIDPFDVLLIVSASMAVAFVATIYPATQAAKLEPVDAIRHE